MKLIKDVGDYKLYVDIQPADSGLFKIDFQSRFEKAKNPKELQTRFSTYLKEDEMKILAEELKRVVDIVNQRS